jgi:putative hydrolase of the HAD superfamily
MAVVRCDPEFEAVVFDYYGTLAEHDGGGVSVGAVLRELGYELSPALARQYWQEGLDGTEHDEHSQSRDHYVAWQHSRLVALLAECGVPVERHDEVVARLRAPGANGRMLAYDDAPDVLRRLRDAGIRTAICSNWDWDLHESLEQAGLTGLVDVVVSSAWVGARKPHSRIYGRTLELLGTMPARTLFVGDTWSCDVAGPRALGMTVAYVRRPHRELDHTEVDVDGVEHHRGPDLSVVLEAVGLPATAAAADQP